MKESEGVSKEAKDSKNQGAPEEDKGIQEVGKEKGNVRASQGGKSAEKGCERMFWCF